ncbi:MAG: hypothetical protein A4E65_01400 [Syntrophorhabdus sp. PtaU1.Bin153]|nr:MAG: hypothetical protein A4E65_01400 [Syntrophorhabdus sp. PtaU1.Bin153]
MIHNLFSHHAEATLEGIAGFSVEGYPDCIKKKLRKLGPFFTLTLVGKMYYMTLRHVFN